MSTLYYFIKDGKPIGPLSLSQLRALQPSGTDFVKAEGWADYKEIREVGALSEALNITYERALPQYYATLDMRLLAAGIDYFLALLIYCCFALAILIKAENKQEQVTLLLFGLLLVPIFKFFISVIGEGSNKHASPGKMLLKISVTDIKGNPIGWGRALGRNLAKITCVLTLGIGYLAGFLDRKQQCFHDKLAKTLVVKERLI